VARETQRRAKVGASSIFLVEVGEGVPVVLVPGGPGLGHYYLRPHMDRLAEKYRLIYYDPLGTGRSPLGNVDRMNLSGAIDEIEVLRETLGIEPLNLLGHSFGALVALLYASRYPESMSSLVLASAAPPFLPDQKEAFDAAMAARRTPNSQDRMKQMAQSEGFAKQDPKTLEDLYRLVFQPFFVDTSNTQQLELNFTEATAAGLMGTEESMVAELSKFDPSGSLSRITCPSLIVYGELEPIPEAFRTELATGIKRSELVLLKHASHFAYLEHPEAFFAAVLNFLQANAESVAPT
jgi:proline iminopeptidase